MKTILIAYATRSGSTRQVAEFIGKELGTPGAQVDVLPISQVSDVTRYDGIIVGGLLYRFGWHAEIVRFLQANEPALKQKPVALFVSGLRLVKTQELDRFGMVHGPVKWAEIFADSDLPLGTIPSRIEVLRRSNSRSEVALCPTECVRWTKRSSPSPWPWTPSMSRLWPVRPGCQKAPSGMT